MAIGNVNVVHDNNNRAERRWWTILWTWKQEVPEVLFPKFPYFESCFPVSETSKPVPPSWCEGHLSHQAALDLVVADFEVHQNVAEPAFNLHDRNSTQQQHCRPEKPALTLPLTRSMMLCSRCKQRGDQRLSNNWQQVHTFPGTQAQQVLDEWVMHFTPQGTTDPALCSPQTICCA